MPSATAEERALHARLLVGDLTAPAELATRLLPGLVRALENRYPEVARRDETLILDAATDAILSYAMSPASFAPARRGLVGYLYMAARGDLLNALAKVRKESAREIASDPVELPDLGRNSEGSDTQTERGIDGQALWSRICSVVTDPREQRVVALMMEGVRETSAYAAELGLSAGAPSDQAKEVKRVKDRLRGRLRRAGWDGFLDDPTGATP